MTQPTTPYTAPVVTISGTGTGATALASANTEVKMIPALSQAVWDFLFTFYGIGPITLPAYYPQMDLREGGVPDPALAGPPMIHIGSEGGILPFPVVHDNRPVGYEYDRRNIVVLNVKEKCVFLAAAERADLIVDFSKFAGKTVILYNDSPAPVPAGDPRNDTYTGCPDMTGSGGPPSTLPGMGSNTRTIMQFRVAAGPVATPFDVAALNAPMAAAFTATQPKPIVPQAAYNVVNPTTPVTDVAGQNVSRIQDTSLTFTPYGATAATTISMKPKTIQELFDDLGRMNATLGTELPFTSAQIQTTVPLNYVDPPTEVLNDRETQIWKITHNGVDTHGVHFHLFDVQVLNRVGWDGAIRMPDPEEYGWKDTVRMNPLEDIIVAVRAQSPGTLPFLVPDSVRPLSPAKPLGSIEGFSNLDPLTGNQFVPAVSNIVANFAWEYVWHCHLLAHEENDMMRPLVMIVAPDAPSGLVASAKSGSVILTWVDNSPNLVNPNAEAGFIIEKADVANGVFGPWAVLTTTGPNVITYTDIKVAPANKYAYRVSAFNAGISAPSAVAQVQVPVAQTLNAPTNLRLSGTPTTTSISMRWSYAGTGAVGFHVQRSIGGVMTTIATVPAGTTQYTNTGLTTGTTYQYQVTAYNATAESAPSNVLTAATR